MYKKILLPIDLTDRHEQALVAAADLAERSGGEVLLLHVVEVISGLTEEEEFYGRLERIARKHLSRLSERLAARRVAARVEVLVGHRGGEIVRYARESGA